MVDFENWPTCECGKKFMHTKGFWESKTGTRIILYQCQTCKNVEIVLADPLSESQKTEAKE